jgi:hypothetical protein
MKWLRLLFFAFAAIGFLSIPFLIQRYTLGFHPAKLHPRLSFHEEWEAPVLSTQKRTAFREILNQPFRFFDLGSQSYVFESEDRKYVLKLFRYNRSQFQIIHQIKRWFHRKNPKRIKSDFFAKIDKTFQAYAAACSSASDCTEVLYAHLNLTSEDLPSIQLTDPIGRRWRLPIDSYRFVLQRKAEPFKKTLKAVYLANDRAKMERLLDSFLILLYERTGRGLKNSDPNYGPNFGFYEGRAIEIDCGNYRKNPDLILPQKRIEEIHRFAVQLYMWLIKHAPEHYPYFHERFTALYEDIEKGREPGFKKNI